MISYQTRVRIWLDACFGVMTHPLRPAEEIAAHRTERVHRFLEEALELAQALHCTRDEAIKLVDYVFSRPRGEPRQEIGGVMVTLAAVSDNFGIDLELAAELELARCWQIIEKIRAKNAAKPKFSPLPGESPPS